MLECDDVVEVRDLDIPMKPSKPIKDEAKKNRGKRIKELEAKTKRTRIALEEYSRVKMPQRTTTFVPFRNDNGAICFGIKYSKLETKGLYDAFEKFWKNGRAQRPAAGSRGFNTRNEKYRMSKPLKISVQEVGKQRFGTAEWSTIFKDIIEYVCTMDGMTDQLELVENSSRPQDHILVRPKF